MATRVWVDTANPIFRRGLVESVAAGARVVAGESESLAPRPDLAAVDVLLFDLECIEAVLSLDGIASTVTVALVPEVGDELLPALVAAGVRGYLVRASLVPQELVRCLETVCEAGRWYPSAPAGRVTFRPAARRLTEREITVLRLLASGDRTNEIAHALSYSERMVKNIVHDVMTKTGSRTRAQAVATVVRDGVI